MQARFCWIRSFVLLSLGFGPALGGESQAASLRIGFESEAELSALEVRGPVALDADLARDGRASLRLDPGARVEIPVAGADECGVLDLWVFDNMGCPVNPRSYCNGPRWALRQSDGTLFGIGEIFAPYLNGAAQYISSETRNEGTWVSSLQHFGRNGRSGGWHRWTLVLDPAKGIGIYVDGQDATARSRFDPSKCALKGFRSVVLFGCQPGEGGWSVWFDDLSVETSGAEPPAVDIRPVEPPAPPAAYAATAPANAIAATAGAQAGPVQVEGHPRKTQGHPCTTWDMEDVARLQALMAASPVLKAQAEALRQSLDRRIQEPVEVPQPRFDEQGRAMHVSDTEIGRIHTALGLDIANLGAAYLLFGDDRYADYAKRLLLAYADAVPHYGVGARPGFNHDPSRVFDQRLSDSIWMLQVARGYDFIYNYPGIADEERRHIQEDLIVSEGRFIAKNTSTLRSPTNWSAISTACVLACGLACDDEWLVNRALFGTNYDPGNPRVPEPSRWWEGEPNRTPSGVELHFSGRSIDVDGMWAEGAMGYQFMALQALVCDAEMLWHHGIDLYRYRDGAMKRLFDSPLLFAYPDLRTPAIHDSGHGSIVGRDAYLYEYAYLRYRDPAYLGILRLLERRLAAAYQQFTVSVLYDMDFADAPDPVPAASVNLHGVGYGILRLTDTRGVRSLLLDYGPNRSHGHPDKLNIDLWAFGRRRVPDAGSTWYEQPLYRRWYATTASHNTLLVDQQSQRPAGAEQLVYVPGETLGIQRARTAAAWPGVAMDRALFLTTDYLADLFGAFSDQAHIYDLAWHPTGECSTDLPLQPIPGPGLTAIGYNELADPRSADPSGGYRIRYLDAGQPLALCAAEGGGATQVILGEGHLGKDRPTAVYQRRRARSTVFGNVLDFSEGGIVRSVEQAGGLDAGYAVLHIALEDGRHDFCLAAYRDGAAAQAQPAATDASQAMVRFDADGATLRAAVLGGGTWLHCPAPKPVVANGGGVLLRRSAPGLALVERTEAGTYIVSNPSPEAAEITVLLPEPRGATVRTLAPDGRPQGEAAGAGFHDGMFRVALPAGGRVEVATEGAQSSYDHRRDLLARLEREREEEERRHRAEELARRTARAEEARRHPVPGKTLVVVQAEDFTGEGGGKVAVTGDKTASIGRAFCKWDAAGHWLEWTATVPTAGYYHVALCYCADRSTARSLTLNGEEVPDAATLAFDATGGWSNGVDNWVLHPLPDPVVSDEPLLIRFREGANTLRLTNLSGGGANLDYLLVYSPDLAPGRLDR